MKKWPVALLFALMALLLNANLSQAAPTDGESEHRDSYYSKWESRKSLIFVSQCGNRAGRSAAIFFEAATGQWELVEEDEGYPVNFGSFDLATGSVRKLETNGGIYSYERVDYLIQELVDSGFDLLAPFSVEKLKALKARKPKCRNIN